MIWIDTCSECATRTRIVAFEGERRFCGDCVIICTNCDAPAPLARATRMAEGDYWCLGCAQALPLLEAQERGRHDAR